MLRSIINEREIKSSTNLNLKIIIKITIYGINEE